jgi:enamine deaminase RidA (YjgF/YER057c/UK114 family)
VEAPAGARWLYVSGQVGVRPDGTMADGIDGQVDQAWANVMAILEAAGMDAGDLVRVNTYVTRPGHVTAVRQGRAKYLAGHRPASTLVVVAALAAPDWLFEVEAVAARA